MFYRVYEDPAGAVRPWPLSHVPLLIDATEWQELKAGLVQRADLLEAILFPSVSFARGYEPVVVTTASGATHGGVIRSDAGDVVVLATGAGEEVRILRREVVDMQPGTVSTMPPGLATQLSRQELTDLLAFLKATRSGAN